MDNADKDHPTDASGQPSSAKPPAEEAESRPDQEADAAVESEAGEQQPVPAGSEAPAEDIPDPAAGSSKTAELTVPETEWPPEEIGPEEEPRQSDIAIGQDDEQSPDSKSTAEGASEPQATVAPDSEGDEAKEKADEPATEMDVEAVAAALAQQRECLVTELFGEERPRQAGAEEVIQAYSAAVSNAAAADVLESDEAAKVAQRVSEIHASAFASEQSDLEGTAAEANRHIETYDNLFVELEALVDDTAGELARLDEEDEQFQNAPGELQATLLNFRKGIEIIHRMFARAKDRKKELAKGLPGPVPDDWQPDAPPTEPDGLGEFVMQLSQSFHKLRDANYHANQDAKKLTEKCHKTAVNAVAGLLSAIDGIDAGLQNEPEMRAGLAPFEEGDNDCSALIESWFQAYHQLNASVDRFLSKTGIEAHSVEPGTPFDPETMEPQGTVANPEMNDEDVAAVMRRGFSLKGESIRPILVDVVRNT